MKNNSKQDKRVEMLLLHTINYKISFESASTKLFFVASPFGFNSSDWYLF